MKRASRKRTSRRLSRNTAEDNRRHATGEQYLAKARERAALSRGGAMGVCKLDTDEFIIASDSYLRALREYGSALSFGVDYQVTMDKITAEFLGYLKRSVDCASESDW